jgi:ubiquinone/menaquinone biosynthesis C-methylase UbiE
VSRKTHWEGVYSTKSPEAVSWYQPRAGLSLELIRRTGIDRPARIIDVGGGASVLVDDLLGAGYRDLTVLDISAEALARARARLGSRAGEVAWVEADVVEAGLPAATFDLWHDRAVFHFLLEAGDRQAYVRTLRRVLRPGGHAIIATFAEDGPERCSGLPVQRYSPQQLHAQLGEGFTLLAHEREDHRTPGGAVQRFQYSLFRGPVSVPEMSISRQYM